MGVLAGRIVFLSFLIAGAAVADTLVITGKINGMGGMNSPKAALHYVLVSPNGASGMIELPMKRGAGFVDGNTFAIESAPIEISNLQMGLFAGRFYSPGDPDMWIPIVQFAPKPGQYSLALPDLRAAHTSLESLFTSYPFRLEQPVIIDHPNRDVVLTSLKMHIEQGRVRSSEDWAVLFQFFHRNKGYLTRADDVTLQRVLDYMNSWYRAVQTEGDPASSAYPEYYVKFLNAVAGLEIGGRELPGGQKLRSYLSETLRQVFSENARLRASSINDTLREFQRAKWYEECVLLAATAIVDVAEDLRAVSEEDRQSRALARRLSASLDLFTGCAQSHYIDSTNFGSMRDVERGFEFTWQELERRTEVRAGFIELFEIVKAVIPKLVDGQDSNEASSAEEENVIAYYNYFLEY